MSAMSTSAPEASKSCMFTSLAERCTDVPLSVARSSMARMYSEESGVPILTAALSSARVGTTMRPVRSGITFTPV